MKDGIQLTLFTHTRPVFGVAPNTLYYKNGHKADFYLYCREDDNTDKKYEYYTGVGICIHCYLAGRELQS